MTKKKNKKRIPNNPDERLAGGLFNANSAEFVPSIETGKLGTASGNIDDYYDFIPDLKGNRFGE